MEDGSRYRVRHDDDHVIHKNVKACCKFCLEAGCGFILCCKAVASFTVDMRLLLKLKVDGWQSMPEWLMLHSKSGKGLTLNFDIELVHKYIQQFKK